MFSLAVAAPAAATVVDVGGGTWDYGSNSSIVWSYYFHGSNKHKTSVYNGSYHHSNCASGGSWANSSASSRWYAVDSSYWDWCS
jgi:hypothetical protein